MTSHVALYQYGNKIHIKDVDTGNVVLVIDCWAEQDVAEKLLAALGVKVDL